MTIQLFSVSEMLFAWGSQGHDLITRVAVRLLQDKVQDNKKCTAPFTNRELMLGHLANIPDNHWRSLDPKLTAVGNPTHFIDWEVLSTNPSFSTVPLDYGKALLQAAKSCEKDSKAQTCPTGGLEGKNLAATLGSAPWRVSQFWDQMQQAMTKLSANKTPDKGTDFETTSNDMLRFAGLMSHFIGDLSMPLHSTVDYDAVSLGQGGLHAYFETAAIEALPIGLAQEVFDAAVKTKPFKNIVMTQIPHKENPASALEIALAVSFVSYKRITELEALDRKHSLLPGKAGEITGKQAPRKPVNETAKYFRPMIVEQLALAADSLAELWLRAWEQGKSPDLSNFHSYFFWFSPDFVAPDYIKN
jgi:hypothetical protein